MLSLYIGEFIQKNILTFLQLFSTSSQNLPDQHGVQGMRKPVRANLQEQGRGDGLPVNLLGRLLLPWRPRPGGWQVRQGGRVQVRAWGSGVCKWASEGRKLRTMVCDVILMLFFIFCFLIFNVLLWRNFFSWYNKMLLYINKHYKNWGFDKPKLCFSNLCCLFLKACFYKAFHSKKIKKVLCRYWIVYFYKKLLLIFLST